MTDLIEELLKVPIDKYTKSFLDDLPKDLKKIALERYHDWLKFNRKHERNMTRQDRVKLWRLRQEKIIPTKAVDWMK